MERKSGSNTDDTIKGHKRAEYGGVLKDINGLWCGGFPKYIGVGELYLAELHGIYEGLMLAYERDHHKVEVHIDSVVTYQAINKNDTKEQT